MAWCKDGHARRQHAAPPSRCHKAQLAIFNVCLCYHSTNANHKTKTRSKDSLAASIVLNKFEASSVEIVCRWEYSSTISEWASQSRTILHLLASTAESARVCSSRGEPSIPLYLVGSGSNCHPYQTTCIRCDKMIQTNPKTHSPRARSVQEAAKWSQYLHSNADPEKYNGFPDSGIWIPS